MALSKKQVDDIVARFDHGNGEDIPALAAEFKVAPTSIRYHLKRAGALDAPSDPERPSDMELGIGEDDAPRMNDLAALLADPSMQKLIDAAVASRLAQMGAPVAVAPDSQTDQMRAFTASLAHLIEVQSMQQAGYIKPLAAEEIDRRASAYVEMKALLADLEVKGNAPEYIVGESGFFECTNAIEFQSGQTIRTYLYPVEDFVPRNRAAEQVHELMIVWIGGHTPGIGEQVEAAMRAANQSAPLVTGTLTPDRTRSGRVELVDTPNQPQKRKRVAGTVVAERHDVSLAERAAGPQGPVFIGDRAA